MNMINKTQTEFEGILDDYFKVALRENPVWANTLGLRAGEGKLGTTGLAAAKRGEGLRKRTLDKLERLAVHELSAEQHLDRLALRAMLLAECEDYERGVHQLEPDAVDCVFGVLLHELQRGEDEPAPKVFS